MTEGSVAVAARRRLWVVFAAAGLVGSLAVWVFLPHEWEIENAWIPLVKVGIFVCLCLAIALFPNRSRYGYLLATLPLLVFLGFILPRVSYYVFHDAALDGTQAREAYTVLYLLLYPGIVLSIALAYRLGGGSPGRVLKVALLGVVLIFSGFLDFLYPLVTPKPIPDVVEANHIRIFLGHFPSYREVGFFLLAHVPVLAGIILLPLDRWLARLTGDEST
jgi:hypothetical protein